MTPKISVIIPVYNVEKYIKKCVCSVINQTYPNLEVILIDDGSTDSSGMICDDFENMYDNIIVIHQKNLGLSSARNKGLEISTGEFVAFIDSDDYIQKDMFDFLYNCIKESGADIAQCGAFDEDESGETNKRYSDIIETYEGEEIIIRYMEGKIARVVWNKLYRRQALDGMMFNPQYLVSEDLLFNYNILKKINKICVNNAPKYHYIKRESSVMNSNIKSYHFQHIDVLYELIQNETHKKLLRLLTNAISEQALWLLNKIIISDSYIDKYNDMRKLVVSNIKYFGFSSNINCKLKIQILLLTICPSLYNRYIKHKNRESR